MIDYKNELNAQQYEAVTTTEGPQLVIAGAGSGKTRTLVYRVAFLVENGVSPSSILLLTFTRKSSHEMMHRASMVLDKRCMSVSGGTFHSFANQILRRYANLVSYDNNFAVVDRADAEDAINLIRADMNLNTRERDFPKKGTILNIISKSINTLSSYEDVIIEEYPEYECEAEVIEEVANRYFDYKQKNNIMDYDDLLTKLLELLKNHEHVRKHLSDTYKYIMVDEYQDTNGIQSQISCLLASGHGNIMVVGDDAQSIYSFRGANFRNIMDFPKIFKDCVITRLEQNYRSTQNILNLTNKIIANAKEKFTKTLFSDIKGGDKPYYVTPFDTYEQARFIAEEIESLHNSGKKLSKIAVLFRSSFHTNELELEIKSRHIPYEKFGGIKFTETAHIKDLISILRIIFNHLDFISWVRILKWFEGIGDKTAINIASEITERGKGLDGLIDKKFISKKYGKNIEELHSLLSDLKSSETDPIKQIERIVEYYKPHFEELYDDSWRRVIDIDSLVELANKYDKLEPFLTDVTLDPPQTAVKNEADDEDKLILSTIHSSKGLEWDTVFIIGLNNGYLPSSRSMDTVEAIEEERRLFYVAATRAETQLYIFSLQNGKDRSSGFGDGVVPLSPSIFIEEIEDFDNLTNFKSIDSDGGKTKFYKMDKWLFKKTQTEASDKSSDKYLNSINDYFNNY